MVLHPMDGDRVLDVGSGLGGPAWLIAAQRGCDVTEQYGTEPVDEGFRGRSDTTLRLEKRCELIV